VNKHGYGCTYFEYNPAQFRRALGWDVTRRNLNRLANCKDALSGVQSILCVDPDDLGERWTLGRTISAQRAQARLLELLGWNETAVETWREAKANARRLEGLKREEARRLKERQEGAKIAALDTLGPSFLPRQGGPRTVQQDGLDGLPTNLDARGAK